MIEELGVTELIYQRSKLIQFDCVSRKGNNNDQEMGIRSKVQDLTSLTLACVSPAYNGTDRLSHSANDIPIDQSDTDEHDSGPQNP
jgi:hypothetical protein